MSTADGSILGTAKVVDHGPNSERYNIVILGDGYRTTELAKYQADVQAFVDTLHTTAPFSELWCGINVHRIDVASTDSGADDPASCGDGSVGSGTLARTYFDATFCGAGSGIRRLLTCNVVTARNVAHGEVPETHVILVLVNSLLYGGSGGQVATFSANASAAEIAFHEMGHTAFGLADEYDYYVGCGSGETGHDIYTGAEPIEPNVTRNANPLTIKWRNALTAPGDALPTTSNPNCAQCDSQPNPKSTGYVGAYVGARYFHCGVYRPSVECRMRGLGRPFCGVCQQVIRTTLAPFLPIAYQGLWWAAPAGVESGWGLNIAHQEDVIFATWFTYDVAGRPWWLSMTAAKATGESYTGTLFQTRGPPFGAVPFDPASVVATAVGTGTLAFTTSDAGTFAYTVNGVSQAKPITRQVFGPLPTCRFGAELDLARATNYQDLWWAAPAGSESGWGVNLTHQGNIIFATWFTYDAAGAPWWVSATAAMSAPNVYSGALYETHGPAFNAVPWSPAAVAATPVGTVTLSFTDGNHGTFAYVVGATTGSKAITRQVFRAPGTTCA